MVFVEILHYPDLDDCFERTSLPTLQTPQPKSPHTHPNGRYSHLQSKLIGSQPVVDPLERAYSPSAIGSISTNPSPASTLCSASFLALRDDDTQSIFTASTTPGSDDFFGEPPDLLSQHRRLSHGVISLLDPQLKGYALGYLSDSAKESWRSSSPDKRKARPVERYAEVAKRHSKSSEKEKKPAPVPPTTPPMTMPPCRYRRAAWWDAFRRGNLATNASSQHFYARHVVQSIGQWTRDELLQLAAAFVWAATDIEFASVVDGMPECDERVVLFASSVYNAFHLAPWNGDGGRFGNAMKDAVIGTFAAVWHQDEGQRALVYVKDPSSYIRRRAASALMLSSFVGDLFRHKFLHRSEVVACVRVLLQNMTLFEHITAIYNILSHAGVMMWQETNNAPAEKSDFFNHLSHRSKMVKDSRVLICPSPLPRGTIEVAESRVKAPVHDPIICSRPLPITVLLVIATVHDWSPPIGVSGNILSVVSLPLTNPPQVFATDPALTASPIGIIASLVQGFFAWRIHVLTQSWALVLLVAMGSVSGTLGGIITSWEVGRTPRFVDFQDFKSFVILWLVSESVTDILVTTILVWHLYVGKPRHLPQTFLTDEGFLKKKHKTGYPASDLMQDPAPDSAPLVTVQTGLITSLVATLDVVFFLVDSTGTHLIFNFPLCKLYTNSLMSSLNSRGGWKFGSPHGDSRRTQAGTDLGVYTSSNLNAAGPNEPRLKVQSSSLPSKKHRSRFLPAIKQPELPYNCIDLFDAALWAALEIGCLRLLQYRFLFDQPGAASPLLYEAGGNSLRTWYHITRSRRQNAPRKTSGMIAIHRSSLHYSGLAGLGCVARREP
ncbi:hypothetical protein CVT24_009950 [Panaeolus cyanescens]|uniref:DUF6534 domain-containing protein n=1 Tax=Panaeolus cyanescens TaxID=181874 RepID=A0A409W3Z4_9AGAR|nr:hypothetical protein CVT24_009950 [Panaeolus cyanescens]